MSIFCVFSHHFITFVVTNIQKMTLVSVSIKKKFQSNEYVNAKTGELLSSEIPNLTSVNVLNPKLKKVDSKNYIIIDSQAMRVIQSLCTKPDLEKVYRMVNMIKGKYNILHDQTGNPHSRKSLRESLDYNESEFSRMMQRLVDHSIINYIDGYREKRKCKLVMINPTFARKKKFFHTDCLQMFNDLSKDVSLKKAYN